MPSEQPTWLLQTVVRALAEGVITHEDAQGTLGE